MKQAQILFFRQALLAWHLEHGRHDLPWKQTRDPYAIWLSEVILQQTRVAQGLPYYQRFLASFPNLQALAEASEEEVFRLWQGLGYYRRARNLHQAAKDLWASGGSFPRSYQALKRLRGVGDYTAAIASFAYDLPHAVLDGNVYRVLSRFCLEPTPIDTPRAKTQFGFLAQLLLDDKQPATYNQAIMDFGALVCLPKQPLCSLCPLASGCRAKAEDRVGELPKKAKKALKKQRFWQQILLRRPEDGALWLFQRSDDDVWAKLYDLPALSFEQDQPDFSLDWADCLPLERLIWTYRGLRTEVLTHQKINIRLWSADWTEAEPPALGGAWFRLEDLLAGAGGALPQGLYRLLLDWQG